MEEGAAVHLVITPLDQTEDVAGVATRVMEERESQDGVLIEVSWNFLAQTPDGTVCYFGEDVDLYSVKIFAQDVGPIVDDAERLTSKAP